MIMTYITDVFVKVVPATVKPSGKLTRNLSKFISSRNLSKSHLSAYMELFGDFISHHLLLEKYVFSHYCMEF